MYSSDTQDRLAEKMKVVRENVRELVLGLSELGLEFTENITAEIVLLAPTSTSLAPQKRFDA
jgi:hypothetical protein